MKETGFFRGWIVDRVKAQMDIEQTHEKTSCLGTEKYLEVTVRGSKGVCFLIISNVKVGFSGYPEACGSLPSQGTRCKVEHLNM